MKTEVREVMVRHRDKGKCEIAEAGLKAQDILDKFEKRQGGGVYDTIPNILAELLTAFDRLIEAVAMEHEDVSARFRAMEDALGVELPDDTPPSVH